MDWDVDCDHDEGNVLDDHVELVECFLAFPLALVDTDFFFFGSLVLNSLLDVCDRDSCKSFGESDLFGPYLMVSLGWSSY